MATAAGRQAVVIGAGMAGLVDAKALSGHFETITVLDRGSVVIVMANEASWDCYHRRGKIELRGHQ